MNKKEKKNVRHKEVSSYLNFQAKDFTRFDSFMLNTVV